MKSTLSMILLVISFAAPSTAAEVTTTLSLGQSDDGTETREADVSAKFQLGGAVQLTGRLDFGMTSVGSQDAGYASAGFGTSFGSIDVGLPRSILELGPLPDPARFNASTTRGTFRPLAAEAALDDGLTGGVRVLTGRGPFRIGTSYHTVDDEGGPVIGVVGRYDIGSTPTVDSVSVYGGVESDGEVERYRLGTEVTLGRGIGSVDFMRTGEDGARASQISLGLEVTDAVTLGVTGLHESQNGLDDGQSRLGLGGSLTLKSGTVLRGGLDTRSSDEFAIDLEIGFQF